MENELAYAVLVTLDEDLARYNDILVGKARYNAKKTITTGKQALSDLLNFNPSLLHWCKLACVDIEKLRNSLTDRYKEAYISFVEEAGAR